MTFNDAKRIFKELFNISYRYRSADDFGVMGFNAFQDMTRGVNVEFYRPLRALFDAIENDKRLTEDNENADENADKVQENNAKVDFYYWQVQDYIDELEQHENATK